MTNKIMVEVDGPSFRKQYCAKNMYANYKDLLNYINSKLGTNMPDSAHTWYMDSRGYEVFKEGCKLLNYEIVEYSMEILEERG